MNVCVKNDIFLLFGQLQIDLNDVENLTCKFDMKLIFRFEYLNVKWTVWSKVLDGPGSQDGLVVLYGTDRDSILNLNHLQI